MRSLFVQCAVAEWDRALYWRPGGPGFESAAATSLWNVGNSVYPALPVSFGGDTKSRRSLPSGVYARGSKISHQSALEMCNLWTPSHGLEKDSTPKHSCVSPTTGCLECT